MAESIGVSVDSDRFDEILREEGCPPEMGDLEIVAKPNGTEDGKTIVVISFSIATGIGTHRVQAVTTLRALSFALDALNAHPKTSS